MYDLLKNQIASLEDFLPALATGEVRLGTFPSGLDGGLCVYIPLWCRKLSLRPAWGRRQQEVMDWSRLTYANTFYMVLRPFVLLTHTNRLYCIYRRFHFSTGFFFILVNSSSIADIRVLVGIYTLTMEAYGEAGSIV